MTAAVCPTPAMAVAPRAKPTSPLATPLPVTRFRLTVRADAPLRLPPYAGSMLRGAFGHALLALSPLPHVDGKPCALHASCPYCQLFAAPPLPGHSLQKFSQMPQPYIIEPPASGLRQVAVGQVFDFHLVLIGNALDMLPTITQAWQIALRKGLGGSACALLSIQEAGSPEGCALDKKLQQQARLHFHTPLRLQVRGDFVRDPHKLSARDLLIALARRHQLLRDVHLGAQAPQYDFAQLVQQASAIQLSAPDMRWFEWGRYSQRQQQEMKLGGLTGELTLQGDLQPFAELLRLGQWLHVGKTPALVWAATSCTTDFMPNNVHTTQKPQQPCILLCTLGASWAVIPEIYGWLAPEVLDLYRHHPQRQMLDELRQRYGLRAPTEIWVCTTEGIQTQQSLALLQQWHQSLKTPVPLRIWKAAGTDQLATQAECTHIRELTLRIALLASEQARGGQLLLSLAGGRKTMSADLQTAGNLFGAHALLHVVGPDPLPSQLLGRSAEEKARQPGLFAHPLPADLAQAVTPLVAGTGQRSDLLDLSLQERTIHSADPDFALPLPSDAEALAWPMPAQGDSLYQELHQRQQESHALMGNFLAQVAADERHENWRSLYRLPPARIQALRATALTPEHLSWLQKLPKADLHRHLGGCLDVPAQQTVAKAIWAASTAAEQAQSLQHIQPLLNIQRWDWHWPQHLRQSADPAGRPANPQERARHCAALLLHANASQLDQHLFADTEPRLALKRQHAQGFAAYERPGELTGSAVLGHPAALLTYAQAIVAQAREEGLHYLELRGSPHKYFPENPVQFLLDLQQALQQAGAQTQAANATGYAPRIGFIWILDRRQPQGHARIVEHACQALEQLPGFMLGLDLAGDEGTHNPENIAHSFQPAFAQCLPVTIHAGEGEQAENIWKAAYHLHADRIGHGLTLAEHPQLAARFRDRGICLELCPSSNREVVGFHDPAHPGSANLPVYPLREFLDQGIPLTLCTDNPGISRTTVANEYLTAARMCQGGLSQWEALALMRQSFVHAFLSSAERETMLKHIDHLVFQQLSEGVT